MLPDEKELINRLSTVSKVFGEIMLRTGSIYPHTVSVPEADAPSISSKIFADMSEVWQSSSTNILGCGSVVVMFRGDPPTSVDPLIQAMCVLGIRGEIMRRSDSVGDAEKASYLEDLALDIQSITESLSKISS